MLAGPRMVGQGQAIMNQNVSKRPKPLWLKILTGFSLLVAVVLVANYESCAPYFRGLPSDEEMIENFQKHRADFERLVQIYREDLSVPINRVGILLPTPEIKAMMDRINVARVRMDNVIWMPPDPYSKDPDFQEEKSKFVAKWYSPETRKFSGVIFRYAHGKVIRLGVVEKRYYYVPFVPKILGGKLIVPATLLTGGIGDIFHSLNTYPPDFKLWDAVYREIEPHWFIQMSQYED
jgi:hypothetical protein